MGSMKKRFDRDDLVGGHIKAKSDKAINRAGEAYNRARVTVRQNQKEEELKQGALQNMMMQQQIMMQKQELIDMSAKIDLQQKMLDNKIAVSQQPPMSFAGLPPLQQLPQQGGMPMDPAMMGQDPNAGMPMDPAMMGGAPMDPAMAMAPQEQQFVQAPVEATAPPFM